MGLLFLLLSQKAYSDIFWIAVHQQKVHWVGDDAYDDIIKDLSDITYKSNLIIILGILEALGFDPSIIKEHAPYLERPAHRMEYVKTWNGITFYNDSKSTAIEATIQGLTTIAPQKTILFLGGLSKGVNRHPLIQNLPDHVEHVICFGAEAEQLHAWCLETVIPSSAHTHLEDGFKKALELAQAGYVLLLSPAGSSYDLYKNFEERGNHFKQLINNLP